MNIINNIEEALNKPNKKLQMSEERVKKALETKITEEYESKQELERRKNEMAFIIGHFILGNLKHHKLANFVPSLFSEMEKSITNKNHRKLFNFPPKETKVRENTKQEQANVSAGNSNTNEQQKNNQGENK